MTRDLTDTRFGRLWFAICTPSFRFALLACGHGHVILRSKHAVKVLEATAGDRGTCGRIRRAVARWTTRYPLSRVVDKVLRRRRLVVIKRYKRDLSVRITIILVIISVSEDEENEVSTSQY